MEFLENLDPNATECIIWPYAKAGRGYGHMVIKGKTVYAHVLSYERYRGPIPEGMIVCHHCDTPLCINPNHLFVDTYRGNTHDMIRKGRQAVGARAGGAKLTDSKVLEIIAQLPTKTDKELATLYGVSPGNIWFIRKGRGWKHLPR